jgi:hypothetical protein
MHKLKTVGVAFLVALVLIAGGIWGYLWYSTKQQVDQIAAMAKPFADISYGGIEVSPAGSIGVNRLRILLNVVNDSIAIGSIRLNAPNILALLNIPPATWQRPASRSVVAIVATTRNPAQRRTSRRQPWCGLTAFAVRRFGCAGLRVDATRSAAPNGRKWATPILSATRAWATG